MKEINIGFYVSDYGYGHAARTIALLKNLLMKNQNFYKISVCSSIHVLKFIQNSMKDYSNILYRVISLDLGYVIKPKSLEIDISKLNYDYLCYMENFPLLVANEKRFLENNSIKIVISDISPIPIAAANLLNICSVGISNFTWYSAYKGLITNRSKLKESYEVLDYFIRLPGSRTEPRWGRKENLETGFFCRDIEINEVEKLAKEINPHNNKIVVYFVLGMSIRSTILNKLQILKNEDYIFIVSSNMDLKGNNIYKIPNDYNESQNLMAISDIVISKPGWSTVSEAIVMNKPLVLIKRCTFPEDEFTINEIKSQDYIHQISLEDLIELKDLSIFIDNKSLSLHDINLKNKKEKHHIVEYVYTLIETVG